MADFDLVFLDDPAFDFTADEILEYIQDYFNSTGELDDWNFDNTTATLLDVVDPGEFPESGNLERKILGELKYLTFGLRNAIQSSKGQLT